MLELHETLGARLSAIWRDRADQICYRVNEAALTCGVALVEAYQSVKAERQAIDYGDIEWHAYNLVSVSDHAVYMHYKLDSRYRHILLDEFQDTNPLQWLTLKSWFAAAAEAESRPVVFLVGDPKQSIYRFRGAEARLFDEAASYLRNEFGASTVPQLESRRCAPAVIEVVNRLFSGEPDFSGFEAHTAHYASKPGRVEVLPLVENGAASILSAAEKSYPMLLMRIPCSRRSRWTKTCAAKRRRGSSSIESIRSSASGSSRMMRPRAKRGRRAMRTSWSSSRGARISRSTSRH